MSVMQLLFLRCNASGTCLYSVATNTNSISTISRHVLPTVNATKFSSLEKNLTPFIRIPRLKETKNCFSKDELLSETHKWKCYTKSLSQPVIEPVCPSSQTTENRTNITVKDDWLPISHGLFYNANTSQKELYPTTDWANHSNTFTCSSEKKGAENSKESSNNGVPSEDKLENVAATLTRELVGIFIKRPDYTIYRHDIVLENRISNKVVTGAINYVQQIGLIRIYAHLRFVFVQLQLKSVEIEKEEGIIRIKFCCKGIGMLKMALEYLPKKLYKKENMANAAPLWLEAVSSYHVDEEGKIFRHVLDNKEEDKGKATISPVQTIREKVSKLREKAPLPSPAL